MRSGRGERDLIPERLANGVGMDLWEANTHSFVVRIWLEEAAGDVGPATWRGHITHVLSGERRYLKDLDGIIAFIAPYLEAMGVRLEDRRRGRSWLRQLEARVRRSVTWQR